MPKKQKTVSIPNQRYEELEHFFNKNVDLLRLIDVESVPSLLKVLSNLGEKPLQEILEAINKVHTQTKPDSDSLKRK